MVLNSGPGEHIDPATSQPTTASGLILPKSLTGLGENIQSLDVRLDSQVAATRELTNAIKDMNTKARQVASTVPNIPSSPLSSGPAQSMQPSLEQRWYSQHRSEYNTPNRYGPRLGDQTIRGRFQVTHPNGEVSEHERTARVISPTGPQPTISGIRERARQAVMNQNWGPNVVTAQHPDTGEEEHRFVDPATGENRLATAEEVSSATRANAAKSIIGNMASGHGLPGIGELGSLLPEGALGGAAEFALPAAGAGLAAYEGINEIGNIIAGQRSANAQYQSILGGSNVAQFGQRLDELGFRASQFGVLNQQQARQAFMGVTQFGLQGSQRGDALSAIVTQYKNMGMSIQQSLQLMGVAIQGGNINFQQLTQTLEGVSQAAQQAGLNTEQMRQQFIANYSQAQQTFGSGPGTTSLAAGMTRAQAALGRGFQNISFAGLNNQNNLFRIANQAGLTPTEVEARGSQNPNWLAQQFGHLFQRQFQESSPQLQRGANQFFNQPGNRGLRTLMQRGQMNSSDWQKVANYTMGHHDVNVPGLTYVAQMLGYPVDKMTPQQITEAALEATSGSFSKAITSAPNPVNERKISTSQQDRLREALHHTVEITGPYGMPEWKTIADSHAVGQVLKGNESLGNQGGGVQNALRLQYARDIAKTGENSGYIDELLRSPSSWNQKYQVKDEQGQEKAVGLSQLINNSRYRAQATSGTAQIVSDQHGQQVLTSLRQQYGAATNKAPVPKTDVNVNVHTTVTAPDGYKATTKVVKSATGTQGSAYSLNPPAPHSTPGNQAS